MSQGFALSYSDAMVDQIEEDARDLAASMEEEITPKR